MPILFEVLRRLTLSARLVSDSLFLSDKIPLHQVLLRFGTHNLEDCKAGAQTQVPKLINDSLPLYKNNSLAAIIFSSVSSAPLQHVLTF